MSARRKQVARAEILAVVHDFKVRLQQIEIIITATVERPRVDTKALLSRLAELESTLIRR